MDDRARRFVAAIVTGELAKGTFFSQFARPDLTFDHDFSHGGHFQWNRFARHKLQRLATQRASNRQLVGAKRNRCWGGHDDRWIGPEYQSHRKRLVRSFVALEIEMSVRGRKDAEGLAVMDLVTIEAQVSRFGARALGHLARRRKEGT